MTKTKLPTWFEGEVYEKGETVANRFTGETEDLTAEETSMYDFIMGCEMLMSESGAYSWNDETRSKYANEMRKGMDWFRRSNPAAYMTLLD